LGVAFNSTFRRLLLTTIELIETAPISHYRSLEEYRNRHTSGLIFQVENTAIFNLAGNIAHGW
jgi:hypothetical protein